MATALSGRRFVGIASLIVGPLVMTVGDLLHPDERMNVSEQMAIVMDQASRWYVAHLLLFIGILLAIPGLLVLADLSAERRPAAGHAARVLVLIGVAALASIFVSEMLIGRFVTDGADMAAALSLWNSMFSGPVVAAVLPAMLAFFVGTGTLAIPLIMGGGGLRWSAALYLVGALFILAEIFSAQVILSQIGNALILVGGATTAWLIQGRGVAQQVG